MENLWCSTFAFHHTYICATKKQRNKVRYDIACPMTRTSTDVGREPCLAPSPGNVFAALAKTPDAWELELWRTNLHLSSRHFWCSCFLRSDISAFTLYAKNVFRLDNLCFRTNKWASSGRPESSQNSSSQFLGESKAGIFGYQARNAKRSINW